MSFTADTKKEITTLPIGKKCCQLAEIAGFLRFAGSVTMGRGGFGIKLQTDNPAVARLYVQLIKEYFGAKTSLSVLEPAQLQKSRQYELRITTDMNSEAILREAGILTVKEGSNIIDQHISSDLVKKRCCKKSLLRGAFLGAGSISDPNKSYHLEISCDSEGIALDIVKIINSFGLKAKLAERRGKQVVYIKDGEQIEDFLTVIGATQQLFKFQDVRITKGLRNDANRAINCVTANTDKAVAAAQKQIADITYIAERKGLDYLKHKIRETAVLRLENPDLTLDELKDLFDPPISKSGLNHRLAKISEIADTIRKEG
ncbi:MAG: DNA-binding protein WhiA [Clostridia bacterium]|nr:DNA-binding protein WhiA [Clostridia bacterium]